MVDGEMHEGGTKSEPATGPIGANPDNPLEHMEG